MGVTWKTLLILVLGLVLIIIALLFIFTAVEPLPGKFSSLLEMLDRAISSLFDISE
jgi:hypothetical protein